MIIINNVSEDIFSINGVNYAKIYQPLKKSLNFIGVYNIYTGVEVLEPVVFNDLIINGDSFNNSNEAVNSLQEVVFSSNYTKLKNEIILKADLGSYNGSLEDLKKDLDSRLFEGVFSYQSFVDLPDASTLLDGESAKVVNDTNLELNGYYSVLNGQWVQDVGFSNLLINSIGLSEKFINDYDAPFLQDVESVGTLENEADLTTELTEDSVYYNTVAEARENGKVTNISIISSVNGQMEFGIIEHDSVSSNTNPYIFVRSFGFFDVQQGVNTLVLNNEDINQGQIVALINGVLPRRSARNVVPNNDLVRAYSDDTPILKTNLSVSYLVTYDYSRNSELKNFLDSKYQEKINLTNELTNEFNKNLNTETKIIGRVDGSVADVGNPNGFNFIYNTVCFAEKDGFIKSMRVFASSSGYVNIIIANHDYISAENNPYVFIRDLGRFNLVAGVNVLTFEQDISIRQGQFVGFNDTNATLQRGSSNYIENNFYISARRVDSNNQVKTSGGLAYEVTFEFREENDFKKILNKHQDSLNKETKAKFYKESYLGHLGLKKINKYDYLTIMEYGQSLSVGGETDEAITTVPIEGNFMFGNSPILNNNQDLTPLANNTEEDAVVAMTNSFSELLRSELNIDINFIATSSGSSGNTIADLSEGGTAYSKFQSHLTLLKREITQNNRKIACIGIPFIQGESDYSEGKANSVLNRANTYEERVQLYKSNLVALKNAMQNEVVNELGQLEKPLFFVHSPQGGWSGQQEMFVHTAQRQACEENEDMIYVGSPYYAPQYGIGHLSTNGYRWMGEMFAKYMYKACVKKIKAEPFTPKKITIKEKEVFIDFLVPNPPIVIDTNTIQEVRNFGFDVYGDGLRLDIVSVDIVSGVSISLKTNQNMSIFSKINVHYGTPDPINRERGEGNICDTDSFVSFYNYVDDTNDVSGADNEIPNRPKDENGNFIFGEKYPMQNWLVAFSEIIEQ